MSRIAYIGPSGVFGGVRAIAEHCNRLARRGHAVTFLSTDGRPIEWLKCEFEQRPLADPGAGYDVAVGTAINTWAVAETLAPRAVGLFQMAEWLFFPAGLADDKATEDAFNNSRAEVMAISKWLGDIARERGKTVHMIRNGIDPEQFFPEVVHGVPHPKPRVLIEGYNSNRAKDWDCMSFRAVRELRYHWGLDFEVWGFSQYPAQFEFDQFWQLPPQDHIRKVYSLSDVFLKASVYEGAPGPDMEAMACGAVVCRAIDFGDDHLLDGENCLKVEYFEQRKFVSNLYRLLTDDDLRARLRANALEYVRTKYDWEGAVDLVEQALTGAVTPAAPPKVDYSYDLAAYNDMQGIITSWETPQAMYLGEWLRQRLQPKSVIDVGCGPGIYLVPFKPDAVVLGVDGAPDAGGALTDGEFLHVDLREDWYPATVATPTEIVATPSETVATLTKTVATPVRVFDLGLCIEVAEHLPPDRADYLIDLLTASAETVFFSAARPGQVGTMHFNLQPREWWIAKFEARGYMLHHLHDELQAALWANEHVRRVQWLLHNSFLITRNPDHAW